MTEFSLDSRLANDCHLVTQSGGISYLLHKNAEVAWFILVPHVQQTEFYELDSSIQIRLCNQINQLSGFIKSNFNSHKINVATIGNVVAQLHIHVIGRRKDDAYWPDVVWGRGFIKSYDEQQVTATGELLKTHLAHNFIS